MNATRTTRPEAASRYHWLRDHGSQDRDRGDRGIATSAIGSRQKREGGGGGSRAEAEQGGTTGSRPKGGERQMAKVIPSRYKKFFTPDAEKIPEVILFLIECAHAQHIKPTQYDLVKSIWLADTAHLNKFGRPITFDNYVAMIHGPVPSLSYDALKPGFEYARIFGEPTPWVSIPTEAADEFIAVKRPSERDLLSDSDKELLKWALETVITLGFRGTRALTHDHPAYIEAWERRGSAAASEMKPELILEDSDNSYLADLKYISENLPQE